MFAYSAFPKKKSNPSSGERQAKNNSSAKTVATFEPGVYIHLPSISGLVLAVKWREAGKSPHLHWEPRRQSGAWGYLCLWGGRGRVRGRDRLSLWVCLHCSSLRTMAALNPAVWEGSSTSSSCLLHPLLTAGNVPHFKLLISSPCWAPCLESPCAHEQCQKTQAYAGRKVCEDWMGCGSPHPTPPGSSYQALNMSN